MGYRHRQAGTTIINVMALVAIFVVAIAWIVSGSLLNPATYFVLPLMIIIGYLFSSMTVSVDERQLTWHFGPGFWKKSIARSEIVSVEPAQMGWGYGYGIRITPRGWLYRVSGRDAAAVSLISGKTVLIGTDEPEKLVAALTG